MDSENEDFIKRLAEPGPARSGAQPIDFWRNEFRVIVRDEVSSALADLRKERER